MDKTGQLIPGGYKADQTKTVYDPSVLSDQNVAEMGGRAATIANREFVATPAKREATVEVDGYFFRVTKDNKTGLPSNAFLRKR